VAARNAPGFPARGPASSGGRAAPAGVPEQLGRVAQLLSRLPGVGEKTALRYALHLATGDEAASRDLGKALVELRDHVRPCSRCGNVAAQAGGRPGAPADGGAPPVLCAICSDTRRDARLLCVVARVQDLLAIERSAVMRGRYFVLGRLLSPLEGVGADELPIDALRERVRDGVAEVLVATPPSVDGEATALLIARELGPEVKVTRIASGVPHGGDLEFADQVTLGRAIEGRKSFG
jgi:recombination protein RecR